MPSRPIEPGPAVSLRRLARTWLDRLREASFRMRLRVRRRRPPAPRRGTPIIVTLTTTPRRLQASETAIASVLLQTFVPDRVVLWLTDEVSRDPLPPGIRRLASAGLEVRFGADLGPHTKLMHALKAFPESILVTADDDTLYPTDWLSGLVDSYGRAPANIHCHRAHLIRVGDDGMPLAYQDWDLGAPGEVGPSMRLLPTGVGGVLFPPNALADEVFNLAALRRLCPTNDDIWFKAMALLQGTATRKVAPQSPRYRHVRSLASAALYLENVTRNDEQVRAVFEAYDLMRLL